MPHARTEKIPPLRAQPCPIPLERIDGKLPIFPGKCLRVDMPAMGRQPAERCFMLFAKLPARGWTCIGAPLHWPEAIDTEAEVVKSWLEQKRAQWEWVKP